MVISNENSMVPWFAKSMTLHSREKLNCLSLNKNSPNMYDNSLKYYKKRHEIINVIELE